MTKKRGPTKLQKESAAGMAKILALICFRQTKLEDFHSGRFPVSKTGDYSDVTVVDGEGNIIPWNEVARFDNDEMRDLMQVFVNRIYTFHLMENKQKIRRAIDDAVRKTYHWDEPEVDESLTSNEWFEKMQ